jgi:uncharacterized protein
MPIALITGASSGIGAVFAKDLAAKGYSLALVARRQEKLEQLAAELTDRYGCKIEILVQDLTEPDAAVKVHEALAAKDWRVDLLINNAGFGGFGEFTKSDRAEVLNMIQLNISSLVDLTYQFLPEMQSRRQGQIINVASIAAFQPMPYVALYAATKAFVLSFSEALWAENAQTGVRILALCPGPTRTEFFGRSGWEGYDEGSPGYGQAATAEEVVQEALAALKSDVSNVVTGGLGNKAITSLSRIAPREVLLKIIAKQFQPKSSK